MADNPITFDPPADPQSATRPAIAGADGQAFEGRDNAPVVADDQPSGTLHLTPKAVRMIKLTREDEGLDDTFGLRVAVRGGGCSGFEYALDFENQSRDNDEILQFDDLQVFVDPISSRYLAGTTIDYSLGVQGTGFKFENPRAVGTCGCGTSFAV